MTKRDCNHYPIDDSEPYCSACTDLFYIDTPFTLGGDDYTVWSWYGSDEFGNNTYQCRRVDGTGTIFLTTDTIDMYI